MTKVVNQFLKKTYHMVNESDEQVVSWGVGDYFIIKDIDKFQKTVLPNYFNHSKYSSFVRQLNFYGFQKVPLDSEIIKACKVPPSLLNNNASCFSHEFFRRDMPELLIKIQRSTARQRNAAAAKRRKKEQETAPTTAAVATASAKSPPEEEEGNEDEPSEEHKSMQQQIIDLKKQVKDMESQIDMKVEHAVKALRSDYLTKMTRLGISHQQLVGAVSVLLHEKQQQSSHSNSTTVVPTLNDNVFSLQRWRLGNHAA